jgi:hypothetical protein
LLDISDFALKGKKITKQESKTLPILKNKQTKQNKTKQNKTKQNKTKNPISNITWHCGASYLGI